MEGGSALSFVALVARDLWRAVAARDASAMVRCVDVGRELFPVAIEHGMTMEQIAETLNVDLDLLEEWMKGAKNG